MRSLMFPTSIVDDFLYDPQQYVKLANSLEYTPDSRGQYPGLGTYDLALKHPRMINYIVTKIMMLYYNLTHERVTWNVSARFQKVNSNYGGGWIHSDWDIALTSIIYLCNSGLGTTIYKPKNVAEFNNTIHLDKKLESYKNPQNVKNYNSFRLENNNQFEKSITVDSQFNRMFCFEGHSYHGVENFINNEDNEDRLTMVLFIQNITALRFPAVHSKMT